MLVFLLSCLFGAVCAVGLWTAFTAHTTIDEIVKRGGSPFPPGEP
jgi:prolyl-tRNA editing enzyme YbaK/EbsC (Cys-tRNA(Pro) deacylase)